MECEKSDGTSLLCLLPAKFSKVVWAQRGDYLIVEPTAEEGASGKVHSTIVHILFPEQVQHLRKLPCWPEGFGETSAVKGFGEASAGRAQAAEAAGAASTEPAQKKPAGENEAGEKEDGDESEDSESDLFVNNNRLHQDSYEESEDEDDEDEDEEV
eukprot:CAMPEP_0177709548 /NCGR_PEP_ID=MMETSP0484_2-20121128/10862_1 /TAXON_ID=354590 /ORGANISM="Rhodomonas lens, Strain RHODO" /LENGTH=155 /DNA_ID=CAMNT_0019221173 /DNA_START=114 /DNA_END=581 /DNA_ORIENTATION=+